MATGWRGEAREEKINNEVGSELRLRGKSEYEDAYKQAKRLMVEGRQPEDIRVALRRKENKLVYSGEDSETQSDWKKAHNRLDDDLIEAASQGAEDALADRPKNYKLPPGY